jgi:hypothetical protein
VPEGLKVNLVQLRFSGGVKIGPDGQFFTDHGGQEYVGEPAPSVDEAWSLLLNGKPIYARTKIREPVVLRQKHVVGRLEH